MVKAGIRSSHDTHVSEDEDESRELGPEFDGITSSQFDNLPYVGNMSVATQEWIEKTGGYEEQNSQEDEAVVDMLVDTDGDEDKPRDPSSRRRFALRKSPSMMSLDDVPTSTPVALSKPVQPKPAPVPVPAPVPPLPRPKVAVPPKRPAQDIARRTKDDAVAQRKETARPTTSNTATEKQRSDKSAVAQRKETTRSATSDTATEEQRREDSNKTKEKSGRVAMSVHDGQSAAKLDAGGSVDAGMDGDAFDKADLDNLLEFLKDDLSSRGSILSLVHNLFSMVDADLQPLHELRTGLAGDKNRRLNPMGMRALSTVRKLIRRLADLAQQMTGVLAESVLGACATPSGQKRDDYEREIFRRFKENSANCELGR